MAARATIFEKSKSKLVAPDKLPIEERVRQRAYEIYMQRGGQDGSDMDDWFQAEDEIRQAEEGSYLSRAEGEGYLYKE
ncbi:MAG TPA: DUF2934 domain-containing protein [Candidatus Sulfopaludibacter sp.]|jgi:hypothetical protein|nr:DUF2934 domain-containing protein [Candidatus Sulfopaludibacter sp.]